MAKLPEGGDDRWNGVAAVALVVFVMALGFYMTARTFEARYQATALRIDAADARSKVLLGKMKELKHTLADMEARAGQTSTPGAPSLSAAQSPSGQWVPPPQRSPQGSAQGNWRPGAPSYPNPGALHPPGMAGPGSPTGGGSQPPPGEGPPGSAHWIPAPSGMPTGGPPTGGPPMAPPTGGPPTGAYPNGRSGMGMPPGSGPPPGASP